MNLLITDKMLQQASDLKMSMIVTMNPNNFLEITTRDPSHLKEIVDSAKTIAEYNQFAEEGKLIVMPFLYLDDLGKIVGYEGRHRAAALIKSNINEMTVSIHLNNKYKNYVGAQHES